MKLHTFFRIALLGLLLVLLIVPVFGAAAAPASAGSALRAGVAPGTPGHFQGPPIGVECDPGGGGSNGGCGGG